MTAPARRTRAQRHYRLVRTAITRTWLADVQRARGQHDLAAATQFTATGAVRALDRLRTTT